MVFGIVAGITGVIVACYLEQRITAENEKVRLKYRKQLKERTVI